MENPPAQTNAAGRREISIDPVKAQGILKELTRKERAAAKAWHERWSFYGRIRELQEEEAQKLGFSLAEYRAGLRALSCQPEPRRYPVVVDPSPAPLPATTSVVFCGDQIPNTEPLPNPDPRSQYQWTQLFGIRYYINLISGSVDTNPANPSPSMVGRRALCPLERYGRVVRTARDYPTRPPHPNPAYDPYKQTSLFLGSIEVGDPISYQLPPASNATPGEAWARPRPVRVLPLCQEALDRVSRCHE